MGLAKQKSATASHAQHKIYKTKNEINGYRRTKLRFMLELESLIAKDIAHLHYNIYSLYLTISPHPD